MTCRLVLSCLLITAVGVCGGCRTDVLFGTGKVPPGPMTDLESPLVVTAAEGADTQEIALVEQVVMHRALYARYLRALQQFYYDLPDQTKRAWAEREFKDVGKVPPYAYLDAEALGGTTALPIEEGGIRIADQQEVDLLEKMASHRSMYGRALRRLSDYYKQTDQGQKLDWVLAELDYQQRIKPYRYILETEVPPADLRPVESIAEADRMFKDAMDLMRQGGHGLPGLYRQERMREALKQFKRLIDLYPTSDKIDEAAFYCGEIHKEYFKHEEPIALLWYQRAIAWNPSLERPARFQSAVILDYRLHDRAKALEMYQACLDHERYLNASNQRFAAARVVQLTEEIENPQAPRTSAEMTGP